MEVNLRETMRAEQTPDVYAGPRCDEHRPLWDVSGDNITLSARHFPPGTVVSVLEPTCPICGQVPCKNVAGGWTCCGDFDWESWAEEKYS